MSHKRKGDEMKILHILPDSNKSVIEAYIKFIRENFNSNDHRIIIVANKASKKNESHKHINVQIVSSLSTQDMINFVDNYDKIIIHYLYFKTTHMLRLLFYPVVFKKIVWVAWGADLYQWKKNIDGNIFERIKTLTKNNIALTFRKRIRYFVGIFPPDIDFFKKEFKSNAKTFYASYTGSLYNQLYSKNKRFCKLEDKVKDSECINIQVGHSSTKALNHLEVLKSLEKFKGENIRLYLPLSYGDKNYGDYVEDRAKEIFNDKAICIREMMSKDDYMEYLSTIDIAIFNTRRQIGLGNISPMLYMEKKIYMPKDSVMYNFYKSQQVDIWDYNEIANFDYSEFIQPLKFKGGRKYIVDNELDLNHKIDMWNKVFEAPLKRGI